jgi:hypothetical protein
MSRIGGKGLTICTTIEIVQSGFLDGVLGFLVHTYYYMYPFLSWCLFFSYPIIRIPKYLGSKEERNPFFHSS